MMAMRYARPWLIRLKRNGGFRRPYKRPVRCWMPSCGRCFGAGNPTVCIPADAQASTASNYQGQYLYNCSTTGTCLVRIRNRGYHTLVALLSAVGQCDLGCRR